MADPVFLSYARAASREHAVAVHEELAKLGISAFLDTEAIEHGDSFPERIVDGLLGARVVVVFAEPVYFHRWYCLLEFRAARTPFLHMAERAGSTRREREEALAPLVIAFPPPGTALDELDRFPSLAKATNWPSVAEPAAVADFVRARLEKSTRTLGELLDAVSGPDGATSYRDLLLEADRLPQPLRIGNRPAVLPPEESIYDAFIGRADDLWRIHDALTTRWGDLATAAGLTGALEGGGGFGKTRLAVEYFYRFGTRHYPGGLFWINAELDSEPQQYEIVRKLDPAAPPQLKDFRDAGGDAAARLDELLRGLPGERLPLVVVDNVPEPPAGTPPPPLETWIPCVGEVPLLVTSRTRVSAARPGAVVPLQVNVLDLDDAVALLTRGDAGRDALSADDWRRIAEWVGRLPLALELLNGLLVHGGMSPAALLRMTEGGNITDALDSAMDVLRGVVPEGALRGITEALSASYERLSPEVQAAARRLAFLAPEPIPEALIEAMGEDLFSPAARVALVNRSFVTKAPGGKVPLFGSMHRVLADFLRTTAADPAEEFLEVGKALLRVMTPGGSRTPEAWPLMNSLAPHAEVLFERLRKEVERKPFAAVAVRLGLGLGVLAWAQGLYAKARKAEGHAVALALDRLGEEHPATLASMNNLAGTYLDQGNLTSARKLQERVVEIGRRVLGEEHPDALTSMSNLAEMYRNQGDLPGARELQERVLEVRRRILGGEHPDTLSSMNNLAGTHWERGDFAGARKLLKEVLEIRGRVLGEEHPDTLTSMSNLAGTYQTQEELTSARELEERVLETRSRLLGEEHPNTLISRNNLAEMYRAQGDLTGARELQERVLEIRRCELGEEHPDTLTSMHNLASTYRAQGDLASAREFQKRVLEVCRRVLGEEHPDTTTSAWNLLHTLMQLEDTEAARQVFTNSLEFLFTCDPASLSADQRQIRDRLQQMIQLPPSSSSEETE